MRKHVTLNQELASELTKGWTTVKGRPGGRLTPRRGEQDQPDESSPERREICEIVGRKMAPIPQREKEAVEAFLKVSGESCRQVARRYAVAPGTVSNWAKARIAKLRPQLEGCL
jgi:DNA-directed RNA polymerase specialized sigma subunit